MYVSPQLEPTTTHIAKGTTTVNTRHTSQGRRIASVIALVVIILSLLWKIRKLSASNVILNKQSE